MKNLKLSTDLKFPLDTVTEALAWIGARGSGKTHGAGKLAEEFYAAGIPFVWLDPVGVAYGLRLSKDGKGPGLSVPVFGGLHGDLPLEPTAGAVLADLIVDKNLSAVLDVSQFDTDAQKARFTSDFAERLFARKKKDPAVLHWIVDEAQEFVPQNPQPGEQMMLHRMQRVLKLGRNFGIGVSLLTQRPQETSKKALNQCQTVLAFRVTGPQERKAMKEWIAAHDLDQALVEKLPSLETGTCHVWSPAFLKVSQGIRILPKWTLDASATPKFGERRAARELAPIDLEKIKADMAATIEKAKAEDPKALRAEIQRLRLEAERAKHPIAQKAVVQEKVVEKRVEVPVLKDAQIKRLESTSNAVFSALSKHNALIAEILTVLAEVRKAAPPYIPHPERRPATGPESVPALPRVPVTVFAPRTDGNKVKEISIPAEGLTAPQQRVLDAAAWLGNIGQKRPNRNLVAFLSKQSPRSSGYANNLSTLKSAGYLVYPDGQTVALTGEGFKAAKRNASRPTSEEIQVVIFSQLPNPQRRIMEVLVRAYPNPVLRGEIATESGQSITSSGFANNLSILRSLGLLEYPSGQDAVAADILFLEVMAR